MFNVSVCDKHACTIHCSEAFSTLGIYCPLVILSVTLNSFFTPYKLHFDMTAVWLNKNHVTKNDQSLGMETDIAFSTYRLAGTQEQH